ncbi:MAG: isoprenylcysteine carboxylmethyltransferase family protein, partial [bacterium]
FLFLTDLAFVSLGYALSLKLFNSHIRSSEPTFFGWFIALFCYQPFFSVFNAGYIEYQHISWEPYMQGPFLQKIWGCLILVVIGIYSWASVAFGLRFSNLTHRGVIRHGPYYFCKHPAYVMKITSFVLVSVPFLISDFETAFRSVVMLALLAVVYYYRAKTEEAHLSGIDETYLAYSNEVDERWRRWLGWWRGKKV